MHYNCTRETHQLLNLPLLNPPLWTPEWYMARENRTAHLHARPPSRLHLQADSSFLQARLPIVKLERARIDTETSSDRSRTKGVITEHARCIMLVWAPRVEEASKPQMPSRVEIEAAAPRPALLRGPKALIRSPWLWQSQRWQVSKSSRPPRDPAPHVTPGLPPREGDARV